MNEKSSAGMFSPDVPSEWTIASARALASNLVKCAKSYEIRQDMESGQIAIAVADFFSK